MKTFWSFFEEKVGDEWINFVDSDERLENAGIKNLAANYSNIAGPLRKTAKREERAQRCSRLAQISSLAGKGKKVITEAREEKMLVSSILRPIAFGSGKRKGVCTATEALEEEHARKSLLAMAWGIKSQTRAREESEQSRSTLQKNKFI